MPDLPTQLAETARPAPATPTPTREERVARAAHGWRDQLVDLGGRNTLLHHRDLSAGTLDLTHAHPTGLAQLLAGRPTRLSSLFREHVALTDARRRAKVIRAKARELAEERGVLACYVAVGLATWTAPVRPDGPSRAPHAPVLLRQAVLRPRGPTHDDYDLDLAPEVELNPVLVHVLAEQHRLALDAEALEELAAPGESGFDPQPAFNGLTELAVDADIEGFRVDPRLVLGTYSYARLPMVADLDAQRATLHGHEVVAALAGDATALGAVRREPQVAVHPDDRDPGSEHLVLDADSSQAAVVDAVLGGSHLVVKGPPGTGKSQTIANLVAALAAAGRSTLFVAEKRAAIDAVLSRLQAVGLDHLVLDVHDGAADRRRTVRRLAEALEQAATTPRTDASDLERTLVERRQRLREHVEALHVSRKPWGVSAFDAVQALAAAPPGPRMPAAALRDLSRREVSDLCEDLAEAASLGAFTLTPGDTAWFGALITSSEQAREALDVAASAAASLPRARALLAPVAADAGLDGAATVADQVAQAELMLRVRATLDTFTPQVYEHPVDDLVVATAEPQRRAELLAASGGRMGRWSRWRTRRRARALLRAGMTVPDLHAALVDVQNQRSVWRRRAGGAGWPRVPDGLTAAVEALAPLVDDLHHLSGMLVEAPDGGDLLRLSLPDLQSRLAALAIDEAGLRTLPRRTAVLLRARELGLGPLLDDMRTRQVDPADVAAELDAAWWRGVHDEIALADPRFGGYDGDHLRRVAAEFRAADDAHVAHGSRRVRRAVAERLVAVLDAHPEQAALVRSEAARQRRHRPLRDLVREAPQVLDAVAPCWAMSPLVVSQVLPPGTTFDVVVFDEASQVRVSEAVPAIARARQVVVAGDERQLPPTSFFTSAEDDPPEPAGGDLSAGQESVLDALSAALPVRRLAWHYRSLDERLIAFANDWVYGNGLVTFPSTGTGGDVVRLVTVDGAEPPTADASVESVDAEVARAVALVVEHARDRPGESLGVITLGVAHARRVEDALRVELVERPGLAAFFAEPDAVGGARAEPFFVKNLERVQGDERDAVILSIGYGRTPDGRVLHRFGPLNVAGGERRLTVAVTRARRRMTVVSSFGAGDLDPRALKADGARMLRDLLAYAATGVSMRQSAASTAGVAPDPVMEGVAVELEGMGVPVTRRHGSSALPLDLALGEPARPGALVLAVESDGATYLASGTVRDRDRLRVSQLERLGWTHERVWTAEAAADPARVAGRLRDVWEDVRDGAVSRVRTAPRAPAAAPVRARPRAKRPDVAPGQPIASYSDDELDEIVAWIDSDTLLRTTAELETEVRGELGFPRRGARIDAVVGAAVRRARQRAGEGRR